VDNDCLAYFAQLSELRCVHIPVLQGISELSMITASGLQHFTSLKNLVELGISGHVKITDSDLQILSSFKNLKIFVKEEEQLEIINFSDWVYI